MKVADNKRNKMIVGNNSASYNDKHPINPIQLNPIGRALRMTSNSKIRRAIKAYRNAPRQVIQKALKF